MDHDEYLKRVKSYIKTPTQEMEKQLEEFCGFCTYVSGQYDKDESFIELRDHLESLEKGRKETNRIFYMALPPSVFITVSQHLKRNCYPKNGISRVIVSQLPAACSVHAVNRPPGREAVRQGPGQLPGAPACACARLDRR
jgi:glucose-6-phosphate 1-dehydrogenase